MFFVLWRKSRSRTAQDPAQDQGQDQIAAPRYASPDMSQPPTVAYKQAVSPHEFAFQNAARHEMDSTETQHGN